MNFHIDEKNYETKQQLLAAGFEQVNALPIGGKHNPIVAEVQDTFNFGAQ